MKKYHSQEKYGRSFGQNPGNHEYHNHRSHEIVIIGPNGPIIVNGSYYSYAW
jgi:hypothetical protein